MPGPDLPGHIKSTTTYEYSENRESVKFFHLSDLDRTYARPTRLEYPRVQVVVRCSIIGACILYVPYGHPPFSYVTDATCCIHRSTHRNDYSRRHKHQQDELIPVTNTPFHAVVTNISQHVDARGIGSFAPHTSSSSHRDDWYQETLPIVFTAHGTRDKSRPIGFPCLVRPLCGDCCCNAFRRDHVCHGVRGRKEYCETKHGSISECHLSATW